MDIRTLKARALAIVIGAVVASLLTSVSAPLAAGAAVRTATPRTVEATAAAAKPKVAAKHPTKPTRGKYHGKHGTGHFVRLTAAERKEIKQCVTAAKASRTARMACFKKYVRAAK